VLAAVDVDSILAKTFLVFYFFLSILGNIAVLNVDVIQDISQNIKNMSALLNLDDMNCTQRRKRSDN
jgi:hypothetical protein